MSASRFGSWRYSSAETDRKSICVHFDVFYEPVKVLSDILFQGGEGTPSEYGIRGVAMALSKVWH